MNVLLYLVFYRHSISLLFSEALKTYDVVFLEKVIDLQLLTIFTKGFMSDIWQGSKYASEYEQKFKNYQSMNKLSKSLSVSTTRLKIFRNIFKV